MCLPIIFFINPARQPKCHQNVCQRSFSLEDFPKHSCLRELAPLCLVFHSQRSFPPQGPPFTPIAPLQEPFAPPGSPPRYPQLPPTARSPPSPTSEAPPGPPALPALPQPPDKAPSALPFPSQPPPPPAPHSHVGVPLPHLPGTSGPPRPPFLTRPRPSIIMQIRIQLRLSRLVSAPGGGAHGLSPIGFICMTSTGSGSEWAWPGGRPTLRALSSARAAGRPANQKAACRRGSAGSSAP